MSSSMPPSSSCTSTKYCLSISVAHVTAMCPSQGNAEIAASGTHCRVPLSQEEPIVPPPSIPPLPSPMSSSVKIWMVVVELNDPGLHVEAVMRCPVPTNLYQNGNNEVSARTASGTMPSLSCRHAISGNSATTPADAPTSGTPMIEVPSVGIFSAVWHGCCSGRSISCNDTLSETLRPPVPLSTGMWTVALTESSDGYRRV
mmetsp:Transcript_11370/g.31477  ORF Transcript_11370/g.31477 Transcript_11370/m.31477 type:complete len:201 (-) Transcript_11370:50-652(-)